jgi:hypothetical protein
MSANFSPLTVRSDRLYNTYMAQEYDTTGKDILNEQINEIARFVLSVPEVEVLADLDTEQQLVRAFRTDITKRVRLDSHEAVLHIELQLRDSTAKPMWARNAHYHGYLVGEHQIPVYSNVIYFFQTPAKTTQGTMRIVGMATIINSTIR